MTPGDGWDPKPVGDVIGEMVTSRGWAARLAIGRLKEVWAAVVGETIAAHSEPLRLTAGVLLVRADPGAWATELALLARQVAARADERLGGGLVSEVKVVAGST